MIETTLIFDSYHTGHRQGYLTHLLKHISTHTLPQKYYFLVSQELKPQLEKFSSEKIFFEWLNPKALGWENQKLLKRTILEGKYIVEYSKKVHAKNCIFMSIDMYQYVIGSSFFIKSGIKVSGILFSPAYGEDVSSYQSIKVSFLYFFKKTRKKLQLLWMVRNKNIQDIFVLLNSKVVEKLNKKIKPVFRVLPDPYTISEHNLRSKKKSNFGFSEEAFVFFVFGILDERKNIPRLIEALVIVKEKLNIPLGILIAGEIHSSQTEKYLEEIIQKSSEKGIEINIFSDFISNVTMYEMYEMSDAALTVYLHFFHSSGIFTHSLFFKKPILVSKGGLLEQLNQNYCPNCAVSPINLDEIVEGLINVLKCKPNIEWANEHIKNNTGEAFAEILLSV